MYRAPREGCGGCDDDGGGADVKVRGGRSRESELPRPGRNCQLGSFSGADGHGRMNLTAPSSPVVPSVGGSSSRCVGDSSKFRRRHPSFPRKLRGSDGLFGDDDDDDDGDAATAA